MEGKEIEKAIYELQGEMSHYLDSIETYLSSIDSKLDAIKRSVDNVSRNR